MNIPSPARIRAIAEHIYSLGCYTQAEELDRAARYQEQLSQALRTIALHTPSFDDIGIRDLCDEGLIMEDSE